MAHGGAARVKTLAATGLPPHRVRRAALRGLIVRAGRGTVAVPDAAPSAILAARLGAGHTCVTALERYGLT